MSGDNQSGGRTLGGDSSEPLPAAWAHPANSQPRIGRIGGASTPSSSSGGDSRLRTLRDLTSGGGPTNASGGAVRAPRDEDEDEDEGEGHEGRDEGESWFAGGERSGISIQNPDRPGIPGGNIVRDLLRQAAEAGPPPGTVPSRRGLFSGGGHTLGSDEVESNFIPDPNAPPPSTEPEEESAIRQLTLWRDGFSVGDGELMRYDDPANVQILAEIRAGRAPPHILNILPNQQVELRVENRVTENYSPPPKRPAAAFSGAGNRLGSPAQDGSGPPVIMPGSFPSAAAAGTSTSGGAERRNMNTLFEVDQSLPTTSVQIRLVDGTRILCRMNLTHKIRDIRNFINASRPENFARPYTIGTTFPNRILEDDTQTIEAARLVNSVVVQRWV